MISLLLAALSSTAVPPVEHRETLAVGGRNVDALYRAEMRIETRELGTRSPRQTNRQICQWTAVIAVSRSLDHAPTPRLLTEDRSFSGSRSGPCTNARRAIAAEVAARGPSLDERLQAAVMVDRPILAAELGGPIPRG